MADTDASWLAVDDIDLDCRIHDRRAALAHASRMLGRRLSVAHLDVEIALWQRESMGSTALGHDLALPHARLATVSAPTAAFMRLHPAVGFDAPDGKPVHFVLALMLPKAEPSRQLDLLARIASKFSGTAFRQRLEAARSPLSAWRHLIEM